MSPTFDMKWQDSFVKIPSLIKIIQIGSPIQLPLPLRPPHWAPQQVSRSLHSYSYQSRAGADGRRVELQTKVKTSTSNPFLCAADFFLQLGICKEAVR